MYVLELLVDQAFTYDHFSSNFFMGSLLTLNTTCFPISMSCNYFLLPVVMETMNNV
jgi:hypothetical protein